MVLMEQLVVQVDQDNIVQQYLLHLVRCILDLVMNYISHQQDYILRVLETLALQLQEYLVLALDL